MWLLEEEIGPSLRETGRPAAELLYPITQGPGAGEEVP
jgi:hypothetical protein